jgi:hypothetical protein
VAAHGVDVLELLEDERFQSAAGESPGGGGAHGAAADDDHIMVC